MIVFPGGVDVHTHVAGGAINFARAMNARGSPPHARRSFAPSRVAQAWGAWRQRRSPPAICTPAWDGHTSTKRPCPSLSARHTHEELADVPIVDKAFAHVDGQQRAAARSARTRGIRTSQASSGLVSVGCQEFTASRQSAPRRRRGVEMGLRTRNNSRRRSKATAMSPGRDHRKALTNLRRTWPAASNAPALQQSRRAGQYRRHTRNAQRLEAPGPHRPFAVSRLRRRRLGHDVFPHRRLGRVLQHPPGRHRTDAGAVLFGDTVTITADGPWQHLLYKLTGRKVGQTSTLKTKPAAASCLTRIARATW